MLYGYNWSIIIWDRSANPKSESNNSDILTQHEGSLRTFHTSRFTFKYADVGLSNLFDYIN